MARRLVDSPEAIQLRSYAPTGKVARLPIAALQKVQIQPTDASQQQRRRFGRSISMDAIELAMRSAMRGAMRDLTDLSRETLDNDPHLAAVVGKRLGSVAALPYEIRPAEGAGVDAKKARDYAAVVREQLTSMRNFRRMLFNIAWGFYDGRSVQENVWRAVNIDTDAGKIVLALYDTDWIHPRCVNFDGNRSLYVVGDDKAVSGNFSSGQGYSLDEEMLERQGLRAKFILFTPAQFGDYQEREGIALRAMYWSFFKRFAQRDLMETIELFGKPWRIGKFAQGFDVNQEDLDALHTILDGIGYSYSAALPPGAEVDVVQPGRTAGDIHLRLEEAVDKQISKLVLGQTGTTDGMSGGLNTSQAGVMQDEQSAIRYRDAAMISEVVENDVTDAIIAVNFGASELPHAPTFHLRADLPPDRKQELERLRLAEQAGLKIPEAEAYAASGFRPPEEGETYLMVEQPPMPIGATTLPVPRPVAVFPSGESPPVGEQQPPVTTAGIGEGTDEESGVVVSITDVGKFVTINEGRSSQGLGPLLNPDGTPDPDGDLTIYAYEMKMGMTYGTVMTSLQARTDAGRPFAYADSESVALGMLEANAQRIAAHVRLCRDPAPIRLEDADHADGYRSDLGSIDEIVARGERELWTASKAWSTKYERAVEGLSDPRAIYNALIRASESQDINIYSRPLERRMRHVVALGALDNALEIGQIDGDGEIVSDWASLEADLYAEGRIALALPDFTKMPFGKAMAWFRARGVMPRAQWENMTAEVKRRTFTVAAIQNVQMLRVIQDELAKQIGAGGDLREFRTFMQARLVESGLIAGTQPATGALSASHVDTVYRTNMANAYGAGRHAHATQPAVMRARPIWQWSPVGDRHTRTTHNQRFALWANDPFWKTCYPPAGHRCRCRVVSRPSSYADQIVSGTTIQGLPDPGFTSGVSSLI